MRVGGSCLSPNVSTQVFYIAPMLPLLCKTEIHAVDSEGVGTYTLGEMTSGLQSARRWMFRLAHGGPPLVLALHTYFDRMEGNKGHPLVPLLLQQNMGPM
jgi:hypothetical protein